MKRLLLLLFTGLFAGGYFPSYGPGNQWETIGSTTQGFFIFDSITLNGETVDNGDEGGGNSPNGGYYAGYSTDWVHFVGHTHTLDGIRGRDKLPK